MKEHCTWRWAVLRRIGALATAAALMAVLLFIPTNLVNAAGTTGDFSVTGGADGTDYDYASGVLTIKTGTALTISGGGTTGDRIVLGNGVAANLTLSGVSVSAGNGSALEIPTGASLTLTIPGGTESRLSGTAGIAVPAGASLIISGSGKLVCTGSGSGAGIGGANDAEGGGSVEIRDTVKIAAQGGQYGAGIGGAGGTASGACGSVTIHASGLSAQSAGNGAAIGSGGIAGTDAAAMIGLQSITYAYNGAEVTLWYTPAANKPVLPTSAWLRGFSASMPSYSTTGYTNLYNTYFGTQGDIVSDSGVSRLLVVDKSSSQQEDKREEPAYGTGVNVRVFVGGESFSVPSILAPNGTLLFSPSQTTFAEMARAALIRGYTILDFLPDNLSAIARETRTDIVSYALRIAPQWLDSIDYSNISIRLAGVRVGTPYFNFTLSAGMIQNLRTEPGFYNFTGTPGSFTFDVLRDGKSIGWENANSPVRIGMRCVPPQDVSTSQMRLYNVSTGELAANCSYQQGILYGDITKAGRYDAKVVAAETPTPPVAAGTAYSVTASVLNVRSGGGTAYPIIGKLSKNMTVISDTTTGAWARITLADGTTGWCSMRYLVPIG